MTDVEVGTEVPPSAPERSNGKTILLAVVGVVTAPFGLLIASGILTPVGLVFAVASFACAVLVLARTTPRKWPRRFAWALLAWSLSPWALGIAYFVWISLFDQITITPAP